MSTQTEALRLADALDAYHTAAHHKQAAVELRRLHLVNAELLEALQLCEGNIKSLLGDWGPIKATGENI